jgi:hypothetical protein
LLPQEGAVRGWPAAPPREPHAAAWREALRSDRALRRHQLGVLAGTWNVAEVRVWGWEGAG